MDSTEVDVETPLLFDSSRPRAPQPHHDHGAAKRVTETRDSHTGSIDTYRSLEDDVVPETAVLGRNLGWSSAYILIISRVIGSGIFATPGAIVSSVGSIGLSLLLWVFGAVISWCALVVALEYGCMLPRSGG
jgi:amino acid permease